MTLPADIHCARDYEALARQVLDAAVHAHMAGGAGHDGAVLRNRAAFEAVQITPRVLRDLSAGSTACTISGQMRPHPIWLAPVAFQSLFHAGGEIATAQAAAATDTPLVVSTLSSATLEDIASSAGPDRWFQLYVQPDRDATLDLVRRAEAAGYTGIVVTVDAPVHAPGMAVLKSGFKGGMTAANLTGYGAQAPAIGTDQSVIFQGLMAQAPTWADIAWLRSQTKLPLWLKGILHPEDARTAVSHGADGIIVSNHGGRELEAAPPTLSVLPRIRAQVGEAYPLLLDSGIRSGQDIFSALALGADGVMVGRLQASALAVAGALGVGHMIKLLREELEVCMALAGCASLSDIRQAQVTSC